MTVVIFVSICRVRNGKVKRIKTFIYKLINF